MHGGAGWRDAGVNPWLEPWLERQLWPLRPSMAHYGRGYGYGYGAPLVGGLAAGALQAAPYAYGDRRYYGDEYYRGGTNCRLRDGEARQYSHYLPEIQQTVCD